MINLAVNGSQYENFSKASCELRLDSLSSTFNFEAVAPDGGILPFKGGDPCQIFVDGEKVLTGYIEVIEISYDDQSHSVYISGRDKLGDLLDSTLDAIDDIRADNLTLKSLIEIIVKHLGLDISVVDEVNPPAFNPAEDLPSPEIGENAFRFIERYAKKRQVLLTSNSNGDLVIANNSGVATGGAVQHIIGANDNNVMSASFSWDTTGRFNAYKMSSSLAPVALNLAGDVDLASLVDQSGGFIDSEIRAGRQLIMLADDNHSEEECKRRANWEADIRKSRGLIYAAVVPFFRVGGQSGELWRLNRIYQIVDDYVGKTQQMLCNSILFSYDSDEGSNTSLGFVGKNAYTLFLSESKYEEVTNVA